MLKKNNPLISKEGFKHIYTLIQNEKISKTNLEQLLNYLSPLPPNFLQEKKEFPKRKEIRKYQQISGIIQILSKSKMPETILEIGAGNANLSKEISKRYPHLKITCLDKNIKLTKKNKKNNSQKNIKYISGDAFHYHPQKKGMIISLHGCGNLTDKAIELSLESKSDILCVPCCYPKISINSLPQSRTLLPEKNYLVDVFKKVKKLDGKLNDNGRTHAHVIRDLYRTLLNIDRSLKLQENGYSVEMYRITQKYIHSKKWKLENGSHIYALIGTINPQSY